MRDRQEGTNSRNRSYQRCDIGSVTRQREVIKYSSPGDYSFTLISYNILADCHMEPEWYQYTPDDSRSSMQRHPKLMTELEMLSGDIICLQEVGDGYEQYLMSEMAQLRYKGEHNRKVQKAQEGLVTLYN